VTVLARPKRGSLVPARNSQTVEAVTSVTTRAAGQSGKATIAARPMAMTGMPSTSGPSPPRWCHQARSASACLTGNWLIGRAPRIEAANGRAAFHWLEDEDRTVS
jgi:hypothetical protein